MLLPQVSAIDEVLLHSNENGSNLIPLEGNKQREVQTDNSLTPAECSIMHADNYSLFLQSPDRFISSLVKNVE